MKADNKEISLDEEMLMWTSYRYCIGRHTYVNSLSNYIAKKYYNKLSKERLIFTAKDIRNCIGDCLRFMSFNFNYDGTVFDNQRKPLEDFFNFLIDKNITEISQLSDITEILVYHENYKEDSQHYYQISKADHNIHTFINSYDFDDLIPWMNLANCFDVDNYKTVTIRLDNKETNITCFESWEKDYEEIPNKPGYYTNKDFGWKKCYISVKDYLEYGEQRSKILDETIINIK